MAVPPAIVVLRLGFSPSSFNRPMRPAFSSVSRSRPRASAVMPFPLHP